ncbi:MAG: alpha/beta fold hydrolase [Candidatus Anammoxibacter sp.]
MHNVKKLLSLVILVGIALFLNCTIQPENVAISSDGVEIRFDVQGEGEPVIFFVHGWSNHKGLWDAQISHFSAHHKTFPIDLAGFGESGNNRNNWTMESFSEDVIAVINKLDLHKVVLVGFSMGGPVVIETANKIPDRILGVVLVDVLQNCEVQIPLKQSTEKEIKDFMEIYEDKDRIRELVPSKVDRSIADRYINMVYKVQTIG